LKESIQIFYEETFDELSDKINDFLETEPGELVDIKYHPGNEEVFISAMIIYIPQTDRKNNFL